MRRFSLVGWILAVLLASLWFLGTQTHVFSPWEGVDSQTRTRYTIPASDCGMRLVTFDNSSPVAVALPQATGDFANCVLRLENLNTGTVTVTPTTSTINGGSTLTVLPKGHATIYAAAGDYVGEYSHTYSQSITATLPGDTITNPTTGTHFASSLTWPANLPPQTTAQIKVGGNLVLSAASSGVNSIQVWSSADEGNHQNWCAGDNFTPLYDNNNSHREVWDESCFVVVMTSGVTGTMNGLTNESAWIGDCAGAGTCNGLGSNIGDSHIPYPGGWYPGYDQEAFEFFNYHGGPPTTVDTTQSYSLYPAMGDAHANETLNLTVFSMTITIP